MNHTYKFALNPHSHDETRPFGLYQNDALNLSFDKKTILISAIGVLQKSLPPLWRGGRKTNSMHLTLHRISGHGEFPL